MTQMLDRLEMADLPDLVTIAKAPMDIRGYGPVKDIAIAKVKPEVERMLAALAKTSAAKMRSTG